MEAVRAMNKEAKDAYFKQRNQKRIGEEKAKEWMKHNEIQHIRYGIDALDSGVPLWKVPNFVRSAPDFIAFKLNAQFLEDRKSVV